MTYGVYGRPRPRARGTPGNPYPGLARRLPHDIRHYMFCRDRSRFARLQATRTRRNRSARTIQRFNRYYSHDVHPGMTSWEVAQMQGATQPPSAF